MRSVAVTVRVVSQPSFCPAASVPCGRMRLIFDLRRSLFEVLETLRGRHRWGALVPIVALLAILVAGCGAAPSAPTATLVRPTVAISTQACPQGHAFLGCNSGAARHPAHTALKHAVLRAQVARAQSGCIFPDVSQWQGHLDWTAAAPFICAAAAKAGEGGSGQDPDFEWNVSQFRALHIPWSAYFFVRGCSDGPQFVAELTAIHFKGDPLALRPVLDMEVRSAFNCAVPMARVIHAAFGVWPIIYTAPGTWPGGASGGLDAWEAAYTLGARPALPFTATVLAWQRYSPPFTLRSVPGLGTIDESIDLAGFSKQLAFPPAPKPSPFLIYPLAPHKIGGVEISERLTVEAWWADGCHNPVIRVECRTTRAHLILLAGRLYSLADVGRDLGEFNLGPDWSSARARELKWPQRRYRIERILNG